MSACKLGSFLQLLTKIGILNVPEWFDAGKVSIKNSFIPFSESAYCSCCLHALQ